MSSAVRACSAAPVSPSAGADKSNFEFFLGIDSCTPGGSGGKRRPERWAPAAVMNWRRLKSFFFGRVGRITHSSEDSGGVRKETGEKGSGKPDSLACLRRGLLRWPSRHRRSHQNGVFILQARRAHQPLAASKRGITALMPRISVAQKCFVREPDDGSRDQEDKPDHEAESAVRGDRCWDS